MAPNPAPETATRTPRTGASLWIGRLALLLGAPLLFVFALEGALRLGGFGRDPSFFIRDTKPGFYRTNPRFTETFFPATFGLKPYNFRLPKQKPAGAVRIFVVGESAAMGVPEPGFAVEPQLQAQLRAAYPGKQVDVYNLGITAINSHVIRMIVRDAAAFSPDAFVIYMGNNEVVGPYGPGSAITSRMLPLGWIRASAWVRTTRLGQLFEKLGQTLQRGKSFHDWRGMEMFAGQTVTADDPRLSAVYANFAANLDDIVHAARGAGAKVILSTVAVNIGDCAPFVSVHRRMAATELAAWREAEDRGVIAAELERWADARTSFEEALRLDPSYAETEFRLARVLAALGETAAARHHYVRAVDLDALRFRADSRINRIIRAAAPANDEAITLVDAADQLGATETSTAPVSSHAWFFEHVHFTWDGNYALARLAAPAVGRAVLGAPTQPWLPPAACAREIGYTRLERLQMLMHMDELTGRPPFTSQLTYAADRTALRDQIEAGLKEMKNGSALQNAVSEIESALSRASDNAFLAFHAAAANGDLGNISRALELNARASDLAPASAETAAQRAFLLQSAHRSSEAVAVLLASAKTEPYYFQTYTLLGQIWAETNDPAGRAYFATLVGKMPESAAVRLGYADLLAKNNEWAEAERQWREVLRRTPDNDAALTSLAKRLISTGRRDDAVAAMVAAYQYNPHSFPNNQRLLEYYAAQGNRDKIIEFMRALAASGPVQPALHSDLADLLLQSGYKTEALVEYIKAKRGAEAAGDIDLARQAADAMRVNGLTD